MPERDIESLGVMGWGLAAAENSSAAAVAVAAVAPWGRGGLIYIYIIYIYNILYSRRVMLVVGYDYKTLLRL